MPTYLYLLVIVVLFVSAGTRASDGMSSALGNTLSEALYLAEELPSVNKPEYFGPGGIAVSKDHKMLYVTAEATRQLLFVNISTNSVTRRVDLPASPTGLVVSPSGNEIYVTCMSEFLPVGVVAVIPSKGENVARVFEAGHSPRSPVLSPEGDVLFVCNRFADKVTAFSSATGARIWETDVAREPYVSAVTPDGSMLLVADYLSSGRNNIDTVEAGVSFISTTGGDLQETVPLFNGSHNCAGLAVSEDGKYAYVSHVTSMHKMTPLNKIGMGWINHNRISVLDLSSKKWLTAIILGNAGAGFADSWDIALEKNKLAVAGAGTNELIIIDLVKMHADIDKYKEDLDQITYSLSLTLGFAKRKALNVIGARNLTSYGDSVAVVGYFSDDIHILDGAQGDSVVGTIDLHGDNEYSILKCPLSRQGEHWFNNAKEMCFQGWHSCQSCHPEGRVSGMKWDLENDGQGNFKDTRSTLLAHVTPPSMITGVRDSLGMAARAKIQYVLFWDPPQLEDRAKLIEEYIASLRPFPSPSLTEFGLSQAALRGKQVFEQLSCGECHPESTYFTDMQRHAGRKTAEDIGPLDGTWDTPTLHELWRTAPYGYNGSCATLQELFYQPVSHGIDQNITDQQISDLVEYLLAL
jgi:DNA-binding beta-propeller fold protein YncE